MLKCFFRPDKYICNKNTEKNSIFIYKLAASKASKILLALNLLSFNLIFHAMLNLFLTIFHHLETNLIHCNGSIYLTRRHENLQATPESHLILKLSLFFRIPSRRGNDIWISNFQSSIFYLFTESPEEPRIFDAQGKEVTTNAGPFREGHELFLSCSVTGGNLHFFLWIHLSNGVLAQQQNHKTNREKGNIVDVCLMVRGWYELKIKPWRHYFKVWSWHSIAYTSNPSAITQSRKKK